MRINRQHKKPFNKSQHIDMAVQQHGPAKEQPVEEAVVRQMMSKIQKNPQETKEIKEQGRGRFPGFSTAAGVCSPKPTGSPGLLAPSFSPSWDANPAHALGCL